MNVNVKLIYSMTGYAQKEKDAVLKSSPRRRASPARARGCQPPLFFKPAQGVDQEKDIQGKKRISWSQVPDGHLAMLRTPLAISQASLQPIT